MIRSNKTFSLEGGNFPRYRMSSEVTVSVGDAPCIKMGNS